jgi:hypothetical protein
MHITLGIALLAVASFAEFVANSTAHETPLFKGINTPITTKPSIAILGHEFTGWTPLRITIYFLLSVMTLVLSQAIPLGMKFLFKNVTRWHLDYHPLTALMSNLVVIFGFTEAQAQSIIHQFHKEHSKDEIVYYATMNVSDTYIKLKKKGRLFLRTNMWELVYVFTSWFIILLGNMVASWVVQTDYIAWIQSSLVNSVLIIYGLMSFIQNVISQVLLLWNDELRVGDIVYIPAYNIAGCILEFGSFQTKIGTVNAPVLKRIVDEMSVRQQQQGTSSNLQNQQVSAIQIGHGIEPQSSSVKFGHSFPNSVQNTLFVGESVGSSLYSSPPTSSYLQPIPIPIPSSSSSSTGGLMGVMSGDISQSTSRNRYVSGNTPGSEYPNYFKDKSNTTPEHHQHSTAYGSLLVISLVPNNVFWQTNINKLPC